MKCPDCGSTAQPKVIKTKYNENGPSIEVIRTYECGCGCRSIGVSRYNWDGDELFFQFPKSP